MTFREKDPLTARNNKKGRIKREARRTGGEGIEG